MSEPTPPTNQMLPRPDSRKALTAGTRSARYWHGRLVVLAVLVLVSSGVFLGMGKYSSRPEFCLNCHEMKPEYQTWSASPHKNTQCVDCHIQRGAVNFVRQKVSALVMVYRHLKGEVPEVIKIKEPIKNETCQFCHREARDGVAEAKAPVDDATYRQLKPGHSKHIGQEEMRCVDCHQGISHAKISEKEDIRSDILAGGITDPGLEEKEYYPNMKPCRECHEKRRGIAGCRTCHDKDMRPERHLAQFWENRSHSGEKISANFDQCFHKCHDPKRGCRNCHPGEVPRAPVPDYTGSAKRYY